MKVFLDVDALHKLGSYDALNAFLALLQAKPSDVRVPGTARFKLRLADPAAATKRHGPQVAARLTAFISVVSQITEGLTEAEKKELADIPGLDPGELLLVAMACREDDAIIVTGDKNALRTLATDPRCAKYASKLAGRVVCLEQVLFDLMKLHGFDWLWSRVQASPGADRGVAMVVAPGMGASDANAREGFTSLISHLRGETGSLLRVP